MSVQQDELEKLRKQLRFRSWHRGTKELDLLMGPFADAHLDDLDAEGLRIYADLLLEPDPDVYTWIVEQTPPPADKDNPVLRMIIDFHNRR